MMAGRIEAYIHSDSTTESKGGVLLDVRCETDFGAKTDVFKDFCKKVAILFYAYFDVSVAAATLNGEEDLGEEDREVIFYRGLPLLSNDAVEQIGDLQDAVEEELGEEILVRRIVKYDLTDDLSGQSGLVADFAISKLAQ